MKNEDFLLSKAQLAAYESWSRRIADAHWNADAGEAISASVEYSFSSVGRHVEARIGSEILILED